MSALLAVSVSVFWLLLPIVVVGKLVAGPVSGGVTGEPKREHLAVARADVERAPRRRRASRTWTTVPIGALQRSTGLPFDGHRVIGAQLRAGAAAVGRPDRSRRAPSPRSCRRR